MQFGTGLIFVFNLILMIAFLWALIAWIKKNGAQRDYYVFKLKRDKLEAMKPEERILVEQIRKYNSLVNAFSDPYEKLSKQAIRAKMNEAREYEKIISKTFDSKNFAKIISPNRLSELRVDWATSKEEFEVAEDLQI